jgi:hypothetical protein
MTDQNKGFLKTGLPAWAVILLVLVILALAVGVGIAGRRELAAQGERPTSTETRIKEPGNSVFMVKHVQRFKDGYTQITLTIGGGRSDEEPFALYHHETRSEFHWDHDRLDACIEGEGYIDKGAYWNDRVILPDGGQVQVVKTCSGPRMIDSRSPAP